MIFDDKTKGTTFCNGALMLCNSVDSDEVLFKASYYVVGDINCSGNLSALFDLIVFGNISADTIDIKGKLFCTGSCHANYKITIQSDCWCDDIRADAIECHENLLAMDIDANEINTSGNIIVGRALGIERLVWSKQKILCGETIFGSGRVSARMILTGERIDLDGGTDAILTPFKSGGGEERFNIVHLSQKYKNSSNYRSFLAEVESKGTEYEQATAKKFLSVLKEVTSIIDSDFKDLHDASVLLRFLDVINSGWFYGWNELNNWKSKLLNHFESFAAGVYPYEETSGQLKELQVNDIVRHKTLGKGRVIGFSDSASGPMFTVSFETCGEKRFLKDQASRFEIVERPGDEPQDEHDTSVECTVSGYGEWLNLLTILHKQSKELSASLNDVLYDNLMSNLGLKSKYVSERFSEKGWNKDGK